MLYFWNTYVKASMLRKTIYLIYSQTKLFACIFVFGCCWVSFRTSRHRFMVTLHSNRTICSANTSIEIVQSKNCHSVCAKWATTKTHACFIMDKAIANQYLWNGWLYICMLAADSKINKLTNVQRIAQSDGITKWHTKRVFYRHRYVSNIMIFSLMINRSFWIRTSQSQTK